MDLVSIIIILAFVLLATFLFFKMYRTHKKDKGKFYENYIRKDALSLMPRSMRNKTLENFGMDEEDFKPIEPWKHVIYILAVSLAVIFVPILIVLLWAAVMLIYGALSQL